MTIKDIMEFIESEYKIINNTPCEVCGGEYFADDLNVDLIDDIPHDICICVCSDCGHEKIFEFYAPFIDEIHKRKRKKGTLN
ncbi:metal-binding protein [Clostridium sp. MSJ-11]|uniref:Metal-binding protein n=1 Tax=Clostridium mobile TaxID=2841512 RepID=A0ABS6EN75_9CLOT|nr:metal-binding protein [Clostridium mobile]MBU5486217.1 metal-binding protein [Clostridium mobile]